MSDLEFSSESEDTVEFVISEENRVIHDYNLRSKKTSTQTSTCYLSDSTPASPKSVFEASDTEVETDNSKMTTNIVMTQEMLQQLLSGVLTSQSQTSTSPIATTPSISEGNFVNCKSRFAGNPEESVDAFIDAISVYKDCANVSETNALLGLSMILDGGAAVWWQGAKVGNKTWNDAMKSLRHAFGKSKPPYRIYRELFAQEQEQETTDIFVNKARALLAKLPVDPDCALPLKCQIDMVNGLLNGRIRRNVSRDSFDTFEKLIDKARSVEMSFAESNPAKVKEENKQKPPRPKCTFCQLYGHTVDKCRKRIAKDAVENKSATTETHGFVRPKTETKSFACYGCGLSGYVRSNCPQCKTATAPGSAPGSTTANSIDHLESEINEINGIRPLLEVEIEGLVGLATVDTGAKCSIAGSRLYRHLIILY